ncbi:MAG: helix-turn-helix domain-containing protein [Bacteroidota bacterium]
MSGSLISSFLSHATIVVVFLYLFFGAFLFVYQKGNQLGKMFMGGFFLTIGLIILDVHLQTIGFYQANPAFAFYLNTLPLLYGPLLWMLTLSVTRLDFQVQRTHLWHFLPYVGAFLVFLGVFHLQAAEFQRTFLERVVSGRNGSHIGSSLVLFLLIGLYIRACYQELNAYRTRIKEQVSSVHRVNLEWLEHVLLGFVGLMIVSLVMQILYHLFGPEALVVQVALVGMLLALFAFVVITISRGIQSEDIFASMEPDPIPLIPTEPESSVDAALLARLTQFMTQEQPFLDPKLKLASLAERIEMPARDLSQLINRGKNQSFFDFVNAHRVAYAQDMMRQSQDAKLTVLEVMYASGFHSKSSFNTAFKKHTLMTPTQWRKSEATP